MNVGDYVRTKGGLISKYIGYEKDEKDKEYNKYNFNNKIYWYYEYYNDYVYEEDFKEWYEENVIKSSPNIIDLIEVGDYVNGGKVYKKEKIYVVINADFGKLFEFMNVYKEDIKSIVTKEQFESMEYKL